MFLVGAENLGFVSARICTKQVNMSHWVFKGQKLDCNVDQAGSAKAKRL